MTLPARDAVLDLASGHVAARALHVVADLGVADAIGDDARHADDLAHEVGATGDAINRVLRLLEAHGLFARDRDGRWQNTESSAYLRSDHPASLLAYALMSGTAFNWAPITSLDHAVRTGETAMSRLHPGGWMAYLDDHPDQRAVFHTAMTAKAHADVAGVLATYDFSSHRRVADIGGGQGHLVRAVLAAHPLAEGVLFELPDVAASATLEPRLQVVAGDFFRDDLPECDAYVLMNVIHDWTDKEAVEVLRAVARAAPPASTILVVEAIVPDDAQGRRSKTLDVIMLAVTGGRERTLPEYAALLADAQVDLVRVTPTPTAFSVVEARTR